MSQYAASLPRRKPGEERTLASLWLEGNAADDALMVDQNLPFDFDTPTPIPYTAVTSNRTPMISTITGQIDRPLTAHKPGAGSEGKPLALRHAGPDACPSPDTQV
ncbi:MAG: hypothetical protein V1758_17545 [Pseudomonadota bacterium]